MNTELIFSIVNAAASFSWLLLLIFPFSKLVHKILLNIIIVGLAILYVIIISQSLNWQTFENTSTLAGIADLFTNPLALLAGWVHYLAFDLMVGLYITNNARRYGINRFILIPCLLFTFMLGPVGLLLYIIIRSIYNKRYFEDYD